MSQDANDTLETKSEGTQTSETQSNGPSGSPSESSSGGTGYVTMAFVFIIISVVLIGVGFETMLTYDTAYGSSDKIVGGDAYNYIIRANRGVGFICAGVASSVISATFGVLSIRASAE